MSFTLSCASLCSFMRIYWRVFQKYYIYDINGLSSESMLRYEKDLMLLIDTLHQALANFSVKHKIFGLGAIPSW